MNNKITSLIAFLMVLCFALSACYTDTTNISEISSENSSENSLNQSSESSDSIDSNYSESDVSDDKVVDPFIYEGTVEIGTISRNDDYSIISHHNIDKLKDFEKILFVINNGKWEYLEEEFDEDEIILGNIIRIGNSVIYYDKINGLFVDKTRNVKLDAYQPQMQMYKETANNIFSGIYTFVESNEEIKNIYQKKIMETPFKNDAAGYSVVSIITNTLKAEAFETRNEFEVTAMYDGKTTRFYNSNTGEYMTEVEGECLTPCYEGFCVGEHGSGYCLAVVFDNEGEEVTFEIITDDWHPHGGYYSEPDVLKNSSYFADFDKRVFLRVIDEYAENGEGYLKYFADNDYRICRKIEIDYPFPDVWESESETPEIKSVSKFGVVYKGNAIIPFEYDRIDYYSTDDCRFGVFRGVKDGKTYYISTSGKILTPEGFDCGSQPCNNKAFVYDGSKVQLIEFTGDESQNFSGEIEVSNQNSEIISLSQEEKDIINRIVNNENFSIGVADCHIDYIISFGGNGLRYCTECGTLLGNSIYRKLSNDDMTALENILIK